MTETDLANAEHRAMVFQIAAERSAARVKELEAEIDHQKHIIDGHVEARRMLADDIVALGTGKPAKLELSRGAENRIAALIAEMGIVKLDLKIRTSERDGSASPLVLLQKWKEADPDRIWFLDGVKDGTFRCSISRFGEYWVGVGLSCDEAIRLALADFAAKEGRP